MELSLLHKTAGEGVYPINLLWTPELGDGRPGLMGTPGLTLLKNFASSVEVRGMWDMDGYLYVVAGDTVYRYQNGSSTTCTGSLSTSTGRVCMVDNGTQILITDGTYGYYVTGTTVTQITDADFPTPASATFQDSYGIVVESDTGKFWISAENDFSTWDSLDFSTAEAEPDDALACLSAYRELYIFGSHSTEPYYNSGNADFPFDRIQGGYIDHGIGAAETAVKGDNAVFWFTNERQVVRCAGPGQGPTVISTPKLQERFKNFTTVSDAFSYCMDILGGTWYVLTFPTENETWVYNCATQRWHQWSSYPYSGTHIRHRSNCYCYHAGKHLVGDYDNGSVYEVDPDCFTDYSNMIRSVLVLPTVVSGGKQIFHNRLQLDVRVGVGSTTGLATGTANMSGGAVASVTVDDGGSGYTTAPTVVFTGGGGTGAVATATLTSGAVSSVTIVNGGSGYTSTPTVTFVGGTQDPQAMLDWSDDDMRTWSNELWRSMGRIGEYKKQVVWRRLGMSRKRNYRITIADSVERKIYDPATLDIEIGDY